MSLGWFKGLSYKGPYLPLEVRSVQHHFRQSQSEGEIWGHPPVLDLVYIKLESHDILTDH